MLESWDSVFECDSYDCEQLDHCSAIVGHYHTVITVQNWMRLSTRKFPHVLDRQTDSRLHFIDINIITWKVTWIVWMTKKYFLNVLDIVSSFHFLLWVMPSTVPQIKTYFFPILRLAQTNMSSNISTDIALLHIATSNSSYATRELQALNITFSSLQCQYRHISTRHNPIFAATFLHHGNDTFS